MHTKQCRVNSCLQYYVHVHTRRVKIHERRSIFGRCVLGDLRLDPLKSKTFGPLFPGFKNPISLNGSPRGPTETLIMGGKDTGNLNKAQTLEDNPEALQLTLI